MSLINYKQFSGTLNKSLVWHITRLIPNTILNVRSMYEYDHINFSKLSFNYKDKLKENRRIQSSNFSPKVLKLSLSI